MSDKILVRTPETLNGNIVKVNEKGQPVYRENILPASARFNIEVDNADKPKHLRSIIAPYIAPVNGRPVPPAPKFFSVAPVAPQPPTSEAPEGDIPGTKEGRVALAKTLHASGKTEAEIAAELKVSERTVADYLKN